MNVEAVVHKQALAAAEERAAMLKWELARVRLMEQAIEQAMAWVNIMKSVNEVIQIFTASSSNRITLKPYLIESHDSFRSPGIAEVLSEASVTEGDGSTLITKLGNQLLAALKVNNTIPQVNKDSEPPAPAQHCTGWAQQPIKWSVEVAATAPTQKRMRKAWE